MAPKLSSEERAEYTAAVDTIRRGMQSFLDAGEALHRIKSKQLYREQFPTFETFAETTFGLTGRRLSQIIESFEFVRNLKSISPSLPTPTIEGVVRPLAGLPANKQLEVYAEAVNANGGQVPTPGQVKAAAASRKPRKSKRIPKPIRLRVPGATVVIVPNKAFQTPAAALAAALDQLRRSEAA
jgi:hypothetical protein